MPNETSDPSRKHAYKILTPLNPHFYIVKPGFTGVDIIFIISAQNIDCVYSLEPPRVPKIFVFSRNVKN